MRVTNMMMTTGMLNSIMSNKADMNKKYEQYATQQRIQNPSDDPVIAIRALKYRANLAETNQYLTKNVEDASSWMELTSSALENMNTLLTELYNKCVSGASDTYETIDRDSMEQQLSNYKEEIYSSLNADNAGRYLFSGYRTNTSVCYTADDSSKIYEIEEALSFRGLYEKSYVQGGATYDPQKTAEQYKSEAPTQNRAYCMDLGYKDVEGMTGLTLYAADGTSKTLKVTEMNSTDTNCYKPKDGEVILLKDTGQLVFADDLYEELRTSKGMISNYEKKNFQKGDVRPEMYYDCVSYSLDKDGNRVASTKKVNLKPQDQDIEYNVSAGQALKVNVLANEVMGTSFSRKIDNILEAVNDAYTVQSEIENVNMLLSDSNKTKEEIEALNTLKEQLETELTLKKSMLRETFSQAQTATKAAQDGEDTPQKVVAKDGGISVRVAKIGVNIANTSVGSRSVRLSIIENRLTQMKTNYTELQTNTEGVDLEEAMVNYTAAQTAYTASLNAAGRVVQNTLLDFL